MACFILWTYNRNEEGAAFDETSENYKTLELALTALQAESAKTEAQIVNTGKWGRTTNYLNVKGVWKKFSLKEIQKHAREKYGL